MSAQPTPGPWVVQQATAHSWPTIHAQGNPVPLARLNSTWRGEALANAAFIARACNSHAALVEALERFMSLCPSSEGLGGHAPMGAFSIAADRARAALALAKGGQQ